MANSIMLNATKKPLAMNGFDVPVENSFCRRDTDKKILTSLILKYQPISKLLSTGSRLAVSIRVAVPCKMISLMVNNNKPIVSVIRGLTPRTGRQTNWNHVGMGALVQHKDTYHAGKGGLDYKI